MWGPTRLWAAVIAGVAVWAMAPRRADAQDVPPPAPFATPFGEATLRMGGRARVRYEGRTTTHEERGFESTAVTAPQDRLAFGQLRFWGELELGGWTRAHVELQHSDTWASHPHQFPEEERSDIRQAWVEVRPPGWSGVALAVGRFSVPTIGDGRILSANDFDNVGTVWDGVAASWRTGPVGYRVMAVNVSEADPIPAWPGEDRNYWLGGAFVEVRAWEWIDIDLTHVERFFDHQYASEKPGSRATGPRLDVTSGVRFALHLGPVDLTLEGYSQLGRHGPDAIVAGATVERIEWRLFDAAPAPALYFEHAFASGDHRNTDGTRGTFDPLFPDQHAHLGPYDALGFRNVNAFATGVSVGVGDLWAPLADWRFTFVARGSFLHEQHDAWYGADGTARTIDPTGSTASSRTLEGELSGWIEGSLFRGQVHVSLGLAHWCPNNLLTDLSFHDHGYRVWVQTTVEF